MYQDISRKLEKIWDMKMTMILNVIGAHGTTPKGLVKGLKNFEKRRQVKIFQTIAFKIGTNNKSPGGFMRLAVILTTVKNHQLTLGWEILKWVKLWEMKP